MSDSRLEAIIIEYKNVSQSLASQKLKLPVVSSDERLEVLTVCTSSSRKSCYDTTNDYGLRADIATRKERTDSFIYVYVYMYTYVGLLCMYVLWSMYVEPMHSSIICMSSFAAKCSHIAMKTLPPSLCSCAVLLLPQNMNHDVCSSLFESSQSGKTWCGRAIAARNGLLIDLEPSGLARVVVKRPGEKTCVVQWCDYSDHDVESSTYSA